MFPFFNRYCLQLRKYNLHATPSPLINCFFGMNPSKHKDFHNSGTLLIGFVFSGSIFIILYRYSRGRFIHRFFGKVSKNTLEFFCISLCYIKRFRCIFGYSSQCRKGSGSINGCSIGRPWARALIQNIIKPGRNHALTPYVVCLMLWRASLMSSHPCLLIFE